MRDWTMSLLRCLACGMRPLRRDAAGVLCVHCGRLYRTRDDVTDFLLSMNAAVAGERAAVTGLDRSAPQATDRLRPLLLRLVSDGLSEAEMREFPCLAHARESRAQIQALLTRRPLPDKADVVELGADHCWASSLLLRAGCRVVAVDITDHLLLAPDGASPSLCRVYADMNRLPLADETMDVVWATAAAHHSWDLSTTFSEAARVLRPAGRLYFCCEPMPSWLRYVFGKNFGRAERQLGINENWIPRARWLRSCRRAGLSPEIVYPTLDAAAVTARLSARKLPACLAPIIRPLLRSLQVSVHLVAVKT